MGLASLFLLSDSHLWCDQNPPDSGVTLGKFGQQAEKQAPSMDQVRWMEAKTSADYNAEYDFVGGPLNEHYTDLRYMYTRRTLLAFLFHGGFEWQRLGFDGRHSLMLPGQLESLNAYLALDFRWSHKDLLRIQSRPGFFSDFEGFDVSDFNAPVDIAYTRIPNYRFQWAIGLSVDTWRRYRVLPGGGFRYHVNDRWQVNMMLPTPQIQYKPLPPLTLFLGADFRGDSYRLARDFGTSHGQPAFDNGVVDYSEIRVGPGFSWNIIPLVELNMQAGVIAERQFDYHNNGLTINNAGAAPFVTLQLHWLFKLTPPEHIGPDIESGRFHAPIFQNLLQFL